MKIKLENICREQGSIKRKHSSLNLCSESVGISPGVSARHCFLESFIPPGFYTLSTYFPIGLPTFSLGLIVPRSPAL